MADARHRRFHALGCRVSYVHGQAVPHFARRSQRLMNCGFTTNAWLKKRADRYVVAGGRIARDSAFGQRRRFSVATPSRGHAGKRASSWIFRAEALPHYGGHIERLIGTMMGKVHFYPGSTFANPKARQDNDPARFAAMTFRESLNVRSAGRSPGATTSKSTARLADRPVALWREHEASLALRMPKDRMAFWVSFLPDAHRTSLDRMGIWLHDIPYWSNALSGQVGRTKRDLPCQNSIHRTSLEYSSSTPTVVS